MGNIVGWVGDVGVLLAAKALLMAQDADRPEEVFALAGGAWALAVAWLVIVTRTPAPAAPTPSSAA